jgi:hypothetical protein
MRSAPAARTGREKTNRVRLVVVLNFGGAEERGLARFGVEALEVPDLEERVPRAVLVLWGMSTEANRVARQTYANSNEDALAGDHMHDAAGRVRSPRLLGLKVLAEQVHGPMDVGKQHTRASRGHARDLIRALQKQRMSDGPHTRCGSLADLEELGRGGRIVDVLDRDDVKERKLPELQRDIKSSS